MESALLVLALGMLGWTLIGKWLTHQQAEARREAAGPR